MYEKLITKTLVLYEIYFLYESGIFKNYFHTLYEISTTLLNVSDELSKFKRNCFIYKMETDIVFYSCFEIQK